MSMCSSHRGAAPWCPSWGIWCRNPCEAALALLTGHSDPPMCLSWALLLLLPNTAPSWAPSPQPGPPVPTVVCLRCLNCVPPIQWRVELGFKLRPLTVSPVFSAKGKTSAIQNKESPKVRNLPHKMGEKHLTTVIIFPSWLSEEDTILQGTQLGGYYIPFWYLVRKHSLNKPHLMRISRSEALS